MSKVSALVLVAALPALAQSRDVDPARKREEARCRRTPNPAECLAKVAAKYDPPPLAPLDPLPIAPLVLPAPPPARPPEVIVVEPPPAPPPVALASPTVVVPQRRPRAAEVVDDLQVGPQSLILDNLQARSELVPGSIQLDFGYRLALDDAAAAHHLFSAGLEAARDASFRWFVRGGLGPRNASDFNVDRRVGGVVGTHHDMLGWSADVAAAGLGYTGATLALVADGQLEVLSADYLRNADLANATHESGTIDQLRMRLTAGATFGNAAFQARVAKYSYGGDPTDALKDVPVRGALFEDDLPGLAGAFQSFSARADARWESRGGLRLAGTYAYLGYVGPLWSSAHIVSGSISQRFGRFRIGLGLVGEEEYDARGASYPTLFGTATLGAAF
jgi:hypothetical protein